MSVSIRIDGKDQTLAELDAMAARAKNPRGMWEDIGVSLETSAQQRFMAGVGPDGQAWPPSFRAKAYGGRTLVDSTRLMQSLTSNATDTGVEVGTNVIYAAIHQLGGTIHAKTSKGLRWAYTARGANKPKWARKMSVTLPARPFLGLDDADEAEILTIAAGWIAGDTPNAA